MVSATQSRSEALASAALRYFTGKPCPHGHLSLRYTKTGKCVECARAWDRDNADERNRKSREHYRENKDRICVRISGYKAANRDKTRALLQEWRRKNPEAQRALRSADRARRRNADGTHTAGDITDILRLQNAKCALCRKSIATKYHIDHILPLSLGGNNFRRNLQLLCQRCNCSKHAKHPIDFARTKGMLI